MAVALALKEAYLARRNWIDWLFACGVAAGGALGFAQYGAYMNGYDKAILAGTVVSAIWLTWFWRPLRTLVAVVAALAIAAMTAYQGDLARAETVFWLKYFLSSQAAILWMSMLYFMSTAFYWLGMVSRRQSAAFWSIGSKLAWGAIGLALIGTLVRWYESYLIGPDVGHIPVSNLYEVFVLFCWITTGFNLYFEEKYQTRALGSFVMLVVSAAVGFLLWYTIVPRRPPKVPHLWPPKLLHPGRGDLMH